MEKLKSNFNNIDNDAPPYQRMKILLKLHAFQLKQRIDLWCTNTSSFSKKKKNLNIII